MDKDRTRLRRIWRLMKDRTTNPNNPIYKYYGGRGITVCLEWVNSFEAFYQWSIENGYRADLTIDRKDNDGNYEPGNCRWADRKTQAANKSTNNRITHKNETHILQEWSEKLHIRHSTLRYRILHSPERIEAPTREVQNNEKVKLITEFIKLNPQASIRTIAKATGLSKSAVHRFIHKTE